MLILLSRMSRAKVLVFLIIREKLFCLNFGDLGAFHAEMANLN